MSTIRFINSSELDFVRELFSLDSRLVGEEMGNEELEAMILSWIPLLDSNRMRISMLFSDSGEPLGMYTAVLFPDVRAWWVHATKIKHTQNHFATSAKILLPAGEFLLDELEGMGYYKFWMAAPELHHTIRNTVMKKYSERLRRYDWFDEYIIPKGQKCDAVPAFDVNRRVCTWSDVIVRLFVLKQEFRKPLVLEERRKIDV